MIIFISKHSPLIAHPPLSGNSSRVYMGTNTPLIIRIIAQSEWKGASCNHNNLIRTIDWPNQEEIRGVGGVWQALDSLLWWPRHFSVIGINPISLHVCPRKDGVSRRDGKTEVANQPVVQTSEWSWNLFVFRCCSILVIFYWWMLSVHPSPWNDLEKNRWPMTAWLHKIANSILLRPQTLKQPQMLYCCSYTSRTKLGNNQVQPRDSELVLQIECGA